MQEKREGKWRMGIPAAAMDSTNTSGVVGGMAPGRPKAWQACPVLTVKILD
jgi:hypothetical protein